MHPIRIAELSGDNNQIVPTEIWLATRRWLHAQDKPSAEPKRLRYKPARQNGVRYRALFRPYWIAKRTIPDWLPLSPKTTGGYVI
jgi:hypothetical protein